MGGLRGLRRLGVRAALAIVGQVRRVGVRAAPAIVRRVGQVRQVRRVRRVGLVGRVGRVRLVGVVCFSVLGTVIRCLYFANFSLILRSSCILPISNVEGRCREKKILQISLIFVWKIIETFYIFAV